ncbi:replication restart helicase PriA [Treponema phagedenis]|uniref:replication restart helicase PriA n=1 Tax=Treponema phagedenis TaxID=162 RepID=UPI0004643389|nr:primosomal protein N' [Treponema phagedenis]NVP22982.1 primosomal protein N' [Treponema phagedenis]QKS92355.1 primosomal protein N' [Treponema phagedenis]QLC57865.1 primosomal protein N' [Treponema phagedenis]QSH94550.1 primosomal protein N' [Treponema phagedenis]
MAQWLELIFNIPVYQSFTYKNLDEYKFESLKGRRAAVKFGSRNLIGFIIDEFDSLPAHFPVEEKDIKTVSRIVDKEALFGQEQIALAQWIAGFYLCSVGETLSAMLPSGRREASFENMSLDVQDFSASSLRLSEEQQRAITEITACKGSGFFYLYGVTGSGKTEVFLQAAEAVIREGKSVIYLVPEIALTHQVIDSVMERFGNIAAVLHSGLTVTKRFSEWMRIKRGDAKIVVGARSAIFAPVQKLGLIIIDEEHDGSYKSGSVPRYHARQVAMHLCVKESCALVMGSATPSVEAWHAMQEGKIRKLTLTKRLSGGAMPEIEVVPLYGEKTLLSERLIEAVRKVKEEGKQSILFLNRRGFSRFFYCRTCGFQLLCKHCSVPLTWHKKQGVMKCHYCGMQTEPPQVCPECGSLDVGYAGIGTEYVEEEVARNFPQCSIRRVDTDSVKPQELKKIITEFKNAKIDILLGTQMVAKGLNFPSVKLVGIALADTGLQMPDFRAAERSFALITQVAGRAGRYIPDGKVIVQTFAPGHPAIVCAVRADSEGFYAQELAQREALHFPPFARLARLVFRSKDEQKAAAAAEGAAKILGTLLSPEAELLGPAECMLSLIAGNYRRQLILRAKQIQPLQKALRQFVQGYKVMSGVYIEIDIDPMNLM